MIKKWVIIITFIIIIGFNPVRGEDRNDNKSILSAPLRTGGNNLFHSLILIPTLESAELMNVGKGCIDAGFDYAVGNFRKEKGQWLLDYDANLMESFVDIKYGLSKKMEVKASLTRGLLAEDERELIFLKGNMGYFSGKRDAGLGDLLLGLKFYLTGLSDKKVGMPYTSSLSLQVKYPLAKKENILSSGGTDLSIAYLETNNITENISIHTQIGGTFTGEESVFREKIDISNPIFYGAGISLLVSKNTALIIQIQGNLNAFKEIKVLNKDPLSMQGGFRYSGNPPDHSRAGNRFFAEGSVGFGLNEVSADFTMMVSLGTTF